jgi:riboflavin kinase/FMN adenylyltransferase
LETFYEAKPGLIKHSAIALGFFDGVHPGHQVVIGEAIAQAKKKGVVPGVVTFRDHPRLLTQGTAPLLLTVIEQRLQLFADLGIEAALVLSFDEELCRLSPHDYVESILVKAMGAQSIAVGYNHHFGRDREGNPALLAEMGKELGFDVQVAPEIHVDGLDLSSSKIRDAILKGDLPLANHLLSRPYAMYGGVVKGDQRGRQIGFPTANLAPYEFQLVPLRGVYAGRARIIDGANSGLPGGLLPVVINVGYRPTFEKSSLAARNNSGIVVEVHILDFEGDLYGKRLDVQFLHYLRAEQKFDGIEELKKQIQEDCRIARNALEEDERQSGGNPSAQSQKTKA